MSDTDTFDRMMTWSDPAMVIVTTTDGHGERAGCLVGFHAQSGIDPGRVSVWLSKANHTFRVAVLASTFAVHFPTEDDIDIASAFGTISGDEVDKFRHCRWHPGPDGVPLLERCPNRVVGSKVAMLDTTADHACVVLDPIESGFVDQRPPLRLHQVIGLHAGHDAGARARPDDASSR